MVDVYMRRQIATLSKPQTTEGASVRPLPGVDSEVSVQTRLGREVELAELAAKGSVPAVDALVVPVEAAFGGVRFPTLGASERPLPRVHSHVCPEVGFGDALEFTDRTAE